MTRVLALALLLFGCGREQNQIVVESDGIEFVIAVQTRLCFARICGDHPRCDALIVSCAHVARIDGARPFITWLQAEAAP